MRFSLRGSIPAAIPIAGVCSAIGVWIFSQVSGYAVLDDYRMISAVQEMKPFHFEGHALTELETGRVIPALLFDLVWISVSEIGDLWYVRAIGIGLVAATVVSVQIWLLSRMKLSGAIPRLALAVAGYLIVLLPSVSATTTWAQKATQLLAFPFATGAGILATSKTPNIKVWLSVASLILLAACTYQHFTMLAVFPTAIWAALSRDANQTRGAVTRVTVVATLCGAALLCNFLFVRLFAPDVLTRIAGRSLSDRIDELIDVVAKGLHLHVEKSPPLVLVSFGLYVLIVLTSVLITRDRVVIRILIAIFFSIVCSAAVSLVSDGDSSYRAIFPIQIVAWLGASILVVYSVRTARLGRLPVTGYLPIIVLCLSAAWLTSDARFTLHDRISRANRADWSDLLCTLSKISSNQPREAMVFRLAPVTTSGPGAVYSEIGLQAKHVDWIFRDQLNLAIQSTPSLKALDGTTFGLLSAENTYPAVLTASGVIDLEQPCVLRFAEP